jgi:hypothetical protein
MPGFQVEAGVGSHEKAVGGFSSTPSFRGSKSAKSDDMDGPENLHPTRSADEKIRVVHILCGLRVF